MTHDRAHGSHTSLLASTTHLVGLDLAVVVRDHVDVDVKLADALVEAQLVGPPFLGLEQAQVLDGVGELGQRRVGGEESRVDTGGWDGAGGERGERGVRGCKG